MRNILKVVGSAGSVALLLSGAAMAAAPPFVAWTVNKSGAITGSPCGAGAIVGNGFIQCSVTLGAVAGVGGIEHIVTIIAEPVNGFVAGDLTVVPRADLAFHSQDLVRIGAGAGAGGVASTMGIKDTVTNPGTAFGTTAEILTGWAATHVSPLLKSRATLTLDLAAPGTVNNGFLSNFSVTADSLLATPTRNEATALVIGQTVQLEGGVLSIDRQRFVLRNQPVVGVITNYTIAGGAAGPANVLTVAAPAAGAAIPTIQGLWIGQSLGTTTTSPIGDDFAVQRLSNLGGGASSVTTRTSLVSTAPVDWGTGGVFFAQFGAAPTF